MSSQNSRRAWGSKPVVGSSRKSSSGRPMMPSATSTRRCWPPESREMRVLACASRPTAAMTSSMSRGRGYRPAYWRSCSRTVTSPACPVACRTIPMRAFQSRPALPGSAPSTGHLAAGAAPVPLEDLDGGRFARSIGSEQRERLTLPDVERHVVDDRPVCVGLAEVPHLHRVRLHVTSLSLPATFAQPPSDVDGIPHSVDATLFDAIVGSDAHPGNLDG